MKTTKKILIIMLFFIGIATFGFILSLFLPKWLVISIFAIVIIAEEVRPKYHYWMITASGFGEICVSVVRTKTEVFSLKDSPVPASQVGRILSVTEIDKYTFDLHEKKGFSHVVLHH